MHRDVLLLKRWQEDQMILTALEKLGGNASAQEISDYIEKNEKDEEGNPVHMPARTIRYRLSTLTEQGILLPTLLETDETKVGLGEGILLLEEVPERTQVLERIINQIPIFHWHVPTNGKIDGYLVHVAYDITQPKMIEELSKLLKKEGLIRNSEFFYIRKHYTKKIDFSSYNPLEGWSCEWKTWKKNIMENLDENMEAPFDIEVSKEVIEYDSKDILILRVLRNDPDSTMTSLASITKLSVGSVRDRIHRLRRMGVIKGYARAYGFAGDLLWFSCFLDIRKKTGSILKSINDLPFPGIFLIEEPNRICVRLGLTTTDLKQFMDGLKTIRPYLDSYSFQFHLPDYVDSKFSDIFNLFDTEQDRWSIPLKDYLGIIKEYAKQ
jgi:DNA-binding Lrp family transcriptional regulator